MPTFKIYFTCLSLRLFKVIDSFLSYISDAKCNEVEEAMPSGQKSYDVRSENEDNFTFTEVNDRYSDLYKTSLTKSQIVRPVDVYECRQDVKADVYWTKSLDSVFTNNNDQFNKLSYQYFASGQGVMRIFPGTGNYQRTFMFVTLLINFEVSTFQNCRLFFKK